MGEKIYNVLVLALVAVVLVLAIALVNSVGMRAAMGDVAMSGKYIALSAKSQSGNDFFCVLDNESRGMAVYQMSSSKKLVLLAARRIEYDVRVIGLNTEPSVSEIRQGVEKAEREAAEKRE